MSLRGNPPTSEAAAISLVKLSVLLLLSCLLLPTTLSCTRKVQDGDGGNAVTLAIPLAPEQAVFLSGVMDDVAADVILNGETVATGIRGGIRGDIQPGIRGGVRGMAARMEGHAPSWPDDGGRDRARPSNGPSLQTSNEPPATSNDIVFAFLVTFYPPPNSTREGANTLTCRLRSIASPDLVYLEAQTVLEWAADDGRPETGGDFTVLLPDFDDDGVSNLVEVASALASSGVGASASGGLPPRTLMDEALATATDGEQRPTPDEVQAAYQSLGQKFQTTLGAQSSVLGPSVELPPLDLDPPDTTITNEALAKRPKSLVGKKLMFLLQCVKPSVFPSPLAGEVEDPPAGVSAGGGCTFSCKLDQPGSAGSYAACASPLVLSATGGLSKDGSHTFRARASDSLGNTDPTPASVTFAVVSVFGPSDPLFPGETMQTQVSSEGGTVSADAGNVNLAFPPGAVSAEIKLTVTKLDPSLYPSPSAQGPNASSSRRPRSRAKGAMGESAGSSDPPTGGGAGGGGPIGTVYDFGPSGTVFNAPVEMRLAYSDADLPMGTDEQKLALATEVHGKWEGIPGSGADVTLNEVKGLVSHFSRFSRIMDTTPPPAPDASRLTVAMNPPGSNDTLSGTAGAVEPGSKVHIYSDGLLTSNVARATSNADGSFGPVGIGDNQADANNKIYIIAVDRAKNMSPVTTITNDVTPPETAISSQPSAVSNSTSVSFTFTSEAGVTFECSVDSGPWSECKSPLVLSATGGLSKDGSYTFAVRAVDIAGNYDPTPASYSWIVDKTPPTVAISGQPSALSNQTSATFSFSCTDPGALTPDPCSFQCYLDLPTTGWSACTSPKTYTSIPDGPHTFQVKATDSTGNESAAVSYTWTINTIPPDTTPPVFSGLTSATAVSTSQINLSWSPAGDNTSTASNLTYEICQSTASGSCASSFSATYITAAGATSYSAGPLPPGTRYHFVVRTRDQAGNAEMNAVEKSAMTWSTTGVAQAIAGGTYHTCALASDGTVKCWGSSPVAVSTLTGVVAITGSPHTCVLASDGTVKCWGYNNYGQLGDGTTSGKTTPVAVSTLTGAIAVTGGFSHTCALTSDGTVKCWGRNINGVLGDGSVLNSSTPVPVTALTQTVGITAGNYHTCALIVDGSARCWGTNQWGQLGDGTTARSLVPIAVSSLGNAAVIQAGVNHTCALMSDGSVRCWGNNGYGQLSDGTTVDKWTPVAVSGLTGAVAIEPSWSMTCALVFDGTVKCWGDNTSGQLGDGTTVGQNLPVTVSSLTGVAGIAAGRASAIVNGVGGSHACALLSDGTVRCWGRNDQGQVGDGTTTNRSTPVAVTNLVGPLGVKLPRLHESTASGAPTRPWREGITAGGVHTCAIVTDGTAKCWGSNMFGQLGDGTTVRSTRPVGVPTLADVGAVETGLAHTCVLVSNGTVKCWGYNSQGELGDGTTIDKAYPVAVSGLGASTSISVGWYHSCALISDGTARCWGRNPYGCLGDGTTMASTTPVVVSGLSGTLQIAAGRDFTCALISDGTAKCWGSNISGQLGDGTSVSKASPVAVTNSSGATTITTGMAHTCMLLSDGMVKCWGRNVNGELGDGTTAVSKPTPVAVSALSGAVAVAAGGFYNCALLSDGTVRCWGNNAAGQLGDGTTANRTVPIAVLSLSGAVAVTAGGHDGAGPGHTCALISDGSVKCWGYNASGQLGDGTTVNRLTPVPVINLP